MIYTRISWPTDGSLVCESTWETGREAGEPARSGTACERNRRSSCDKRPAINRRNTDWPAASRRRTSTSSDAAAVLDCTALSTADCIGESSYGTNLSVSVVDWLAIILSNVVTESWMTWIDDRHHTITSPCVVGAQVPRQSVEMGKLPSEEHGADEEAADVQIAGASDITHERRERSDWRKKNQKCLVCSVVEFFKIEEPKGRNIIITDGSDPSVVHGRPLHRRVQEDVKNQSESAEKCAQAVNFVVQEQESR